MTRSEQAAADIATLLRARNALIWITSPEEARVERYLAEAAACAGYAVKTWDVASGICSADGTAAPALVQDPGTALGEIRAATKGEANRCVWVMRDLSAWLGGPLGATTARQLRNLARELPVVPRENAQAIVVLSATADIPPELAGQFPVIEWPRPDRAEIAALLDATISALPADLQVTAAPNGNRDAAIDAAIGLTGDEASGCFARSLVQSRRIDPALVATEKRRVIAGVRGLEWLDPLPGGLDAVGGLPNLKCWLRKRAKAYTPAARVYGLPAPKGVLLVGVPGSGKSYTAKAVAATWNVPLIKLDLGAIKGKFVGESEASLRRAFQVIDAVGRCVVWLDEIEKTLAGATQGAADGGVSADALSVILNWMQEQAAAFVVATSNDVTGLPPELLRRGRLDAVFFLDIPDAGERVEILQAALRSYGRDPAAVGNLNTVAVACAGFTGSEISALIPEALYAAFAEDARALVTDDLIAAAGSVIPLSKTMNEKITSMRTWAKGRARPASGADTDTGLRPISRALDL